MDKELQRELGLVCATFALETKEAVSHGQHATPLYHQVSTGFFGNVKEMEESLVEAKRLQEKIEEMTLRKTKISKKRLKKVFDNKVDWFMSAEEALKLKVIDEII